MRVAVAVPVTREPSPVHLAEAVAAVQGAAPTEAQLLVLLILEVAAVPELTITHSLALVVLVWSLFVLHELRLPQLARQR